VLDDLGLKMISGHTVMGRQHWDESKKDFSDSWKFTVGRCSCSGQQYVVSPSMDNSMRKITTTSKDTWMSLTSAASL
jgi:hypothetical protein